MQNKRNIFRNLAILATICCGAANATPIRYDVNDVASNNTQAGYLAVDLNGSNNVLFTGVGGATIEDRDRNADNTNGAGGDTTNNDMWRDFIFARNSSSQISGMDISISGLLINTYYDVRLWAFDEGSNTANDTGRHMTWNGQALAIYNGPDPSSLNDQVVNFKAMTDASGILTLEGRIGSIIGSCCNVFVNGFELTEAKAVSTPATLALLGLGLAGIGFSRRRK